MSDDTPAAGEGTTPEARTIRPLVINVPPPPRSRVVRAWAVLTFWSLFACIGLLLIGPLVTAMRAKHAAPEAWQWLAVFTAAVVAATVLCTSVMYVPRVFTWPRREQVLEVTGNSIVVVTISPTRRFRREIPVAAVRQIGSFDGLVFAFTGKKRIALLGFLPPAEAKRHAQALREALGLPPSNRASA